jgi:hypothetical protein
MLKINLESRAAAAGPHQQCTCHLLKCIKAGTKSPRHNFYLFIQNKTGTEQMTNPENSVFRYLFFSIPLNLSQGQQCPISKTTHHICELEVPKHVFHNEPVEKRMKNSHSKCFKRRQAPKT